MSQKTQTCDKYFWFVFGQKHDDVHASHEGDESHFTPTAAEESI